VVKKILIADYEADILKSVSFRLRKSGYEVLTAEDGGTAFEVCRDIKSDDELKKIPVIFLTASSGSATDETASAHGAEGFILKPFEALTLIGKIKSLIG
jgi:two-component system, OmpR family, alkaline phosphatase synthesis response regulator PhoP